MKKKMLKRIIDSDDSEKNKIDRLRKRYKYLKEKNTKIEESNQMKYINFHLKKLGAKV